MKKLLTTVCHIKMLTKNRKLFTTIDNHVNIGVIRFVESNKLDRILIYTNEIKRANIWIIKVS